jgi:cation diffusion facilitator CzcD-associated flavoprotein CzcO
VSYLERVAAHHAIDVQFGADVVRIDPASGGWQVATTAGERSARQVVVATGLDRIPWTPDWTGRSGFTPPVRHVADLARPADLHGQRVLLVGAGNSGVDIAGHLVDAGVADLWVSVRTPPNVLPDEIHGVPLQVVALTGGRLPERTRDWLAKLFTRYAFGDLAPYGLPHPVDGPYRHLRTTGVTVAIDRGFVAALKSGRLRIVAEIDRLDGTEVVLRDGARLRPDVVLAATGYRTGLEQVVGHLGVLDEHGRPRILPGSVSAPPGLHFVGFWPAVEGNLRLHRPEARRIAGLIAR